MSHPGHLLLSCFSFTGEYLQGKLHCVAHVKYQQIQFGLFKTWNTLSTIWSFNCMHVIMEEKQGSKKGLLYVFAAINVFVNMQCYFDWWPLEKFIQTKILPILINCITFLNRNYIWKAIPEVTIQGMFGEYLAKFGQNPTSNNTTGVVCS